MDELTPEPEPVPRCEHCGRPTPDEAFCTWCGAQRTGGVHRARFRAHHFAAHPGEHIAQPSVISTLLPHLPSHRQHEFRWGLLAGLAAVVGLVAGGQVVAAIFAAALLVPVLYIVYLYEAQVYRDEPLLVLLLTLFAGAGLAVAVLVVAGTVISQGSPLEVASGGSLVAGAVVLPLIEEVVKPLPVFLFRSIRRFEETVDGLVFGIAVGLGFAGAETIRDFYHVITYEKLNVASASWLYPLLSAAVLSPLMQGSCTGAIAASLWRGPTRFRSRALYLAGVPVALVGHVAFTYGSRLITNHGADQLTVLVWQAGVDAALLVFVRVLLHRALIDEAEDFGYRPVVCPHCRRGVEASAFCPHCGASVNAAPRTGLGVLTSDRPVEGGAVAAPVAVNDPPVDRGGGPGAGSGG